MKFLEGLLSSKGASSSMRLGMLSCVYAGIAISFYAAYTHAIDANTISLVTRLLVCGFGGKAIQKFAEAKSIE